MKTMQTQNTQESTPLYTVILQTGIMKRDVLLNRCYSCSY